MAIPHPYYTNKRCYFTLDNGDQPDAIHTCGDIVQAKLHMSPQYDESLTVSNVSVKFTGEVRTLITTGSGNDSRTYRASTSLFCFSTDIASRRAITINSHQTWDVAFQFPWAVLPHPSQEVFGPSSAFPHEPHHRPPPSWRQQCYSRIQSVDYYLEATTIRHGRIMNHNDLEQLAIHFCPPLDIPDPSPSYISGPKDTIMRTSRILDPEKSNEHYGFITRSKDFFSSSNRNPSAVFTLEASAPTVRCLGDQIPISLRLSYIENSSTAPQQPEVTMSSLYARMSEVTRYRVAMKQLIGGPRELSRQVKTKIVIAERRFGRRVVYDRMRLDELAPLWLPSTVGPSFATFSISRQYILKISAKFNCAGKDYDIVLVNHPLTVHPARAMYRPLPGALPRLEPPIAPQYQDDEDRMDLPPAYTSALLQNPSRLLAYE
ncbi:MAG: hypothetical protein LQ352_001789 [Teloschistes flavicans]|nr:MAG: hypothetical protein LQ352_001789 [Teloschistes flavicans]